MDPLFLDNRSIIANLALEVNNKYPNKSIWCYTGYTWDELIEYKNSGKDLEAILENIDVLLDGKFDLRKANLKLHYVDSSNQCIIDVKKILYIDNNKILEGEEV